MKISCDVAEDLMPLVKDGIASEGSTQLLKGHIAECQTCKTLFESQGYLPTKSSAPQVRKLKWVLFTAMGALIIIGSLIGYFLSSANTPMPIALLLIGLLSLIPFAIILKKEKPNKMSRFFYGKALGTAILFGLLGLFLLLRYVFGLF